MRAGGPARIAALLALAAAAASGAQELPSAECVAALRHARLRAAEGDFAAARHGAETAVALPGCELPALSALLALLREEGAPPDVVAALRARLEPRLRDPATPLPPGLLVHLASLPGEAADAELLLGALAARRDATDPAGAAAQPGATVELLSVVSWLEQRLGRLADARATVERLLAVAPAEEWRWRALELDFALERWPEVAATLETMLSVAAAPDSLRELYVTALAELGRHRELLAQLDRLAPGAAADPAARERYVALLLEAGWGLRDARRDEEAEALFRRALELEPACEPARLVLLHLYATAEERQSHAAAVVERRQREDDPQALYEEGSQLLAAGDLATARDLLERAAPGLAGTVFAEAAWYNLGLAAFRLEEWDRAARAFGEAARLDADRGDTQYQLGVALYRASRCGEAIGPLARALELLPGKQDAHYFLGACYAATGDAAAAARERELYRRSRPGG